MGKLLSSVFVFLVLISCHHSKMESQYHSYNNRITRLKFIADSLYNDKDYSDAIKSFDTLIQLDPQNGEFYSKRGYSYGMFFKDPGRKEAIADYLMSIKLGHDKATCYYNLGIAYMFINDSLSIFYLEKSLALEPTNLRHYIILEEYKKKIKKRESDLLK